MCENYPFWASSFFTKLGFGHFVSTTTAKRTICGIESMPSESACYPAKLSHATSPAGQATQILFGCHVSKSARSSALRAPKLTPLLRLHGRRYQRQGTTHRAGDEALAWIEYLPRFTVLFCRSPLSTTQKSTTPSLELVSSFGFAVLTEDSVAHKMIPSAHSALLTSGCVPLAPVSCGLLVAPRVCSWTSFSSFSFGWVLTH